MKNTSHWTTALAIATLLSSLNATSLLARSDLDNPMFRPRTDGNAKRDLELLLDVLNRASDVDGPINPLGNFQLRNSTEKKPDPSSRLEFSPIVADKIAKSPANGESQSTDQEAEKKPTIDPKNRKQDTSPNGTSPKATPPKASTSIAVLPGPHYTIIQPVLPLFSQRVIDDFGPANQYLVSLAAATMPWRSDSGSYLANFQDIPGGSGGVFPSGSPGGFSQGPISGIPNNTQVMPDASAFPPTLNPSAIGNSPLVNPNPPISNPIPTNPGQFYQPPPQPFYPNQQLVPNSALGAAPMRSSSDAMPTYSRPAPMVHGLPFVSGAPCQFDARYMVSRNAYRQSGDACAPTRCAPNSYATQPGGSPYSYVPPTYMPYNNNGYDSGYRPFIGFGQSLANAQLGRGIIGQPTAYVEGQPLRNFIRYIFP